MYIVRPFQVDIQIANDEKSVVCGCYPVEQVGQIVKEHLRHVDGPRSVDNDDDTGLRPDRGTSGDRLKRRRARVQRNGGGHFEQML